MDIKVIGAGLGGLAVSCLLAEKGHSVTILEKNSEAGGKINEIRTEGFRFDTGPSLLTMPFILDKLFDFCGESLSDYLNITPVDPICRYFYPSGTVFDCFQESGLNTAQIQEFASQDVASYEKFQKYSEQLYERTKDAFLLNPLYGFSDLSSLSFTDIFKIDAFSTVAERVDEMFESSEMRKFFKRFTTYNGSSPYQAPATLNVIPHVELALGGYYISGGIYKLVQAVLKLAEKKGVEIIYNCEISDISITNSRVDGVTSTDGNYYGADIIISNAGAYETYLNFLGDDAISSRKQDKIENLEPSCSGYVLLLGINKKFPKLEHHNIFFSKNYREEFRQIFENKVMPEDPTIYVANTSHSDPAHAPEGSSNLFVLVNAPYLSDNFDWSKQEEHYREKIISLLEKRGLENLKEHIVVSKSITPREFYQKYRSNRGSIYGTSSNSKWSAFMRPRNKCRSVEGLYLVGGSTHPGGGIPLVTLSAFHACKLISRFEE